MDNFEIGENLFYQKHFDEAIEYYLTSKEDRIKHIHIANCYLCKKDYKKALEYLSKSKKEEPIIIQTYNILLGIVKYEQGHRETGIKHILLHFLSNKFRFLLYLIYFFCWILVNFIIYQHIIDVSYINKLSYFFIMMQIYALISIIMHRQPQLKLCAAFLYSITCVVQPVFQYIHFSILFFSTITLAILGFSNCIEQEAIKKYIPAFIDVYINVENYETALNLCNIVIENAPKWIDVTKYYEYKRSIKEKMQK